ncbi:MAG: prolyl oligopeptidase family serine peptidase [Planctomycetes bacterium]|jgi:dienelactone hydrolase|nr:prolyl oligopeptidase family serine peptidase [Planctomycetota bacterium]
MRFFASIAVLASSWLPAQGSALPYGTACTPSAVTTSGHAPNPGAGQLLLYEANLAAGSLPFVVLGQSATTWGATPLPLALGSLGLPSCSLLAEPLVIEAATAPAGAAEYALTVPATPGLVASTWYAQWLNVGDPALGGALPLTFSQGVALTLGSVVGMPGFTLVGNPTAVGGATWTYVATVDGIAYDLRGKLYKPSQPPAGGHVNYPAVVISHGFGGNVNSYSSQIAATLRSFGLVCIMTNLTHAANVPLGAPGLATDVGASAANVLRNRKCLDLLQSLGYVDLRRVAAHGHSMGAFATAALVGTHPQRFLVASHTAGGMSTQPGAAATSPAQAQGIQVPYQMHHGDADTVVPLALDQQLAAQLAANPTVHELLVYGGYTHAQIAIDAGMLATVRGWYQQHGLLP